MFYEEVYGTHRAVGDFSGRQILGKDQKPEKIRRTDDDRRLWSINTLNEAFKDDMDKAVSIERRIAAMKRCHEEGIRTTCFISPIFPEITEVFGIIEKIKDFCDYIWLENLNLRGNFKADIMNYIAENYPDLLPLYRQIYNKNDRTYWEILDRKVSEYAREKGFLYVVDKEPFLRDPTGKPIIINFFYHSQIKQSAKKR